MFINFIYKFHFVFMFMFTSDMGRRPGAGAGGRGRGRSPDTAHDLQDRSPSSPDDPPAYIHHASTSMASPSATPTPPSGTQQGSFTTPAGLPQLFIDHHE
ncbi:hypothetical protein Dimus_038478 [Dionaea muscipula]